MNTFMPSKRNYLSIRFFFCFFCIPCIINLLLPPVPFPFPLPPPFPFPSPVLLRFRFRFLCSPFRLYSITPCSYLIVGTLRFALVLPTPMPSPASCHSPSGITTCRPRNRSARGRSDGSIPRRHRIYNGVYGGQCDRSGLSLSSG